MSELTVSGGVGVFRKLVFYYARRIAFTLLAYRDTFI